MLFRSKNQDPELYNVVQNLWGDFSGANNEHFKIPDLRGIFLRGVSGERVDKFKDPEAEARDYTFKSNEAGSFQQDSIKKHSHELKTLQVTNDLDGSVGPDGNSWNGYHKQSTKEEGTFETRPINAYVHYMIKAKDL